MRRNYAPIFKLLPALALLASACVAARADAPAPGRPSASYHSQTWTTEHGLPGDTVRAVTQTRDGYLWVATQAGLARFDGVRFKVFGKQNEPAFRTDECNVLLEGSDGWLWVGTIGGGLMRYRDGRFETYGRAEGLPTDVINGLYEDREGRLWITSYEALTLFEGGRFKTFSTADGGASVYAVPFREDAEGRVWCFRSRGLGPNGRGTLLFYKDGELHSGDEAARLHAFAGGPAATAFAGRGSAFWVNDTAAHTLSRFDADSAEGGRVVYDAGNAPTSAHEDARGDLWFTNGRQELRLAREGRVLTVTEGPWPGGGINSLYADREGNLWVGSSGGLTRLRPMPFRAYTTAEGLSNETVWTIFEDARGDLWAGTNDGVSRLRGDEFTVYGARDGMAASGAVSIAEDLEGRLWFASTLGLTSYDGREFRTYARREGLLNENVRAVHADGRGRLWVGTVGGLHLFEGGRFRAYTTADGLSHNNVLFIHEDKAGSLWVGTAAGLNRLREDGRFEVFTKRDGLGSDIVISAREASDGSLWFGTVGGGVARMSGGKFAAVTSAAGLGDDTVTTILEDGAGGLWMGSTRGVLRVSLKELNAFADGLARSVSCVTYGKADGLPTTDCSGGTQPAGWRTRDGRLWFPTSKGIAVVDPAALRRNELQPPVVVESLVVDREPRPLGAGAVELQPGSRAVEFHFTALSFVDPSKVKFRYRLEGFERDWVEAGARREAFYTNLPPGTYSFRVLASNDDGVWNERGAELRFTLRPYFYQTVWFYLLCALVAAASMWGVHRVRVRQLRREFVAVLGERNRIARELHDTLAQGFTSVSMQLEAVSAKMGDGGEAAREHLNQARLLVRSSLAEARRSVRDLRSEWLDGGDLADALSGMARQLTAGADVRVEVSVTGASRHLPERVENTLLRVGQEALTNAVRHASPASVRVRLDYEEARVRLEVSDDGRGFPPETNGQGRGGGFGLRGMRERVEQAGGTLDVRSREGAG
ncbi:MAG TPA: two-component regulator propeller domain-containing protein, partial [Pyrinomonadaceae bacterium]|nr:two-component regulator propeller domain-containing protein [Pyrinomonadaceae bacterium]